MVAFLLTLTFAPNVLAGTSTSRPTCLDVLEWCQDPHNFMDKNCPADTTALDFNPAECQSLYDVIGQNDCVVRAFRSGSPSDDPCADAQVRQYGPETLDILADSVACVDFSYSHVLCVDEFRQLNPDKAEVQSAFKCIFEAANKAEFADDKDAQACLEFLGNLDGLSRPTAELDATASVPGPSESTRLGMPLFHVCNFCNCCPDFPPQSLRGPSPRGGGDVPTARPTLSGMAYEGTYRPRPSEIVLKPEGPTTLSDEKQQALCGCICPGEIMCNYVYRCTPDERQRQLARCSTRATQLVGSTTALTVSEPAVSTARPTHAADGLLTALCGAICPGDDRVGLYRCTPDERRRQLARCPLTGEHDKIPFIPMMTAADKADPTCVDVLEWCQDPHNFMTKNCPNYSSAKDFDPATCQNLYTIIGQSDCVVRAFRSGSTNEDPCATVQLPFGDYDEATVDILETVVACENFSYANGFCVDEFSKLNPSEADEDRAFECIFAAAKQPEYEKNADAQACLKFEAEYNAEEASGSD